MPRDPIILTLALDEPSQSWFDALRQQHFPPERLHVGAHVTLFHALPGEAAADLLALISQLCQDTTPSPIGITGLRFLGRGTAFALHAPRIAPLRAAIALRFAEHLTAQDRAAWSPHVTIQNKVAPATARQTMAELAAIAWPTAIEALGIDAWHYRGGPWQKLASHPFAANPSLAAAVPAG